MNISSVSTSAYARCFDFAVQDAAIQEGAAGELIGELESENNPLSGMENDGPGDVLDEGRNGKLDGFGHGTASRELGEGSALGDISKAFGRDILREAEELANGEAGSSAPGQSMQDRIGGAIGRAQGAACEGNGGKTDFATAGGLLGGILGGLGTVVGYVMGGIVDTIAGNPGGARVDGAQGAGGSGGSRETKESNGKDGTGGTGGAGGSSGVPGKQVGDDQEGRDTKGSPVINSLELQRRANAGDGRAATILAARGGSAAGMAPAWTKNSDAREGQGKGRPDGEAFLKSAVSLGLTRERDERAEPAGARPSHEFAVAMAARAANPVIQPMPV